MKAAIADTIDDNAWTPIQYPNAIWEEAEQRWISDAEVAEIDYTAFTSRAKAEHVTARLIVRRVTRLHAIIEGVHADPRAGALPHLPSGHFPANAAWLQCAVMAFNLTRAAGALTGGRRTEATTASLRAHLISVPARIATSVRRPTLHLPRDWPFETGWQQLFDTTTGPPTPAAA